MQKGEGDILDCQKRYVSFQSDEPCIGVFQHLQIQLFMEATDRYGDSIVISKFASERVCKYLPKVYQ